MERIWGLIIKMFSGRSPITHSVNGPVPGTQNVQKGPNVRVSEHIPSFKGIKNIWGMSRPCREFKGLCKKCPPPKKKEINRSPDRLLGLDAGYIINMLLRRAQGTICCYVTAGGGGGGGGSTGDYREDMKATHDKKRSLQSSWVKKHGSINFWGGSSGVRY